MKLSRNNKVYDIDKLREDKKFVEERFKYEDGAFGHCISLPSIYDLKEHQRNSFLIRVGEKLQPLDWSDNLIGRLDRQTLINMYADIKLKVKDPKWKPLLELMERSTFAIPESKALVQAIFSKSKILTKSVKNKDGEWEEVPDTFDLWNARKRELIAQRLDLFEEAIDIATVNSPKGGGLNINKTLLTVEPSTGNAI